MQRFAWVSLALFVFLATGCHRAEQDAAGEGKIGSKGDGTSQEQGSMQPDSVVDPALVGVWQGAITGPAGSWQVTFHLPSNGAYRSNIEGPGNPPDEMGTFHAKNGKWSLEATSGANPGRTDQGTYQLADVDTMTLIGQTGPVTWKRVATPPGQPGETMQPGISEPADRNHPTATSELDRQISCLAYAPDGKTLAIGQENTIVLWDLAKGAKRATLEGHEDTVVSVAFSPNGKVLASSGGQDHTVKLWDAQTGKELFNLRPPMDPTVAAVAFSPDSKVLAAQYGDSTVKLWDVDTGAGKTVLQGGVNNLAFSPDGKTLGVAGEDGSVKLWDWAAGKVASTLTGPLRRRPGGGGASSSTLDSLAFSPDGKMMATECQEQAYKASSKDRNESTVILWDLATSKPKTTLRGHSNFGQAMAFSPDGKMLALASDEGTYEKPDNVVNVWETTSGQKLAAFRGHEGSVNVVAFGPDSKTVATVDGAKVKLWGLATELAVLPADSASPPVTPSPAPDNSPPAAPTPPPDNTPPATPPKPAGHQGAVYALAFSPDGKTLASGSEDGTIKFWDVPSDKERTTIDVVKDAIHGLAFAPDGKTLASADAESKTVKLWDPITGKELTTLKGHFRDVLSVAFSPDGKTLASGSQDLTARIWDLATGQTRITLSKQGTPVTFVVFSPNGKILATPSQWEVNLYDVTTGELRTALKGHRDYVTSVAFSPDGKVVVSGSQDRNHPVIPWNVATGKPLGLLKDNLDEVTALAISPDGKMVATGGKRLQDGKPHIEVTLWDVATSKELASLQWHTQQITCVVFSPDGKTLASAGYDWSVKFWDVAKALDQKGGS